MLARIAAVAAALMLLTAVAANADRVPVHGSLRLVPIHAADPFGGPDYTFATYRTTLTLESRTIPAWCTTDLRLDGSQLGTTDPATGAFAPTTLRRPSPTAPTPAPAAAGCR